LCVASIDFDKPIIQAAKLKLCTQEIVLSFSPDRVLRSSDLDKIAEKRT
jgi:hypothetical protein